MLRGRAVDGAVGAHTASPGTALVTPTAAQMLSRHAALENKAI